MAVYVDNYGAAFGRMIMCHMIADSRDELLAMVDRIGVKRNWIQKAGTYAEHFDICLSKRDKAVAAGAIELSPQNLVRRMLEKREPSASAGCGRLTGCGRKLDLKWRESEKS